MTIITKRIKNAFPSPQPLITYYVSLSVINEFQKYKEYGDERFIISTDLFEIRKTLISLKIPYCELNEMISKHSLNRSSHRRCSARKGILKKLSTSHKKTPVPESLFT